MKKLIIIIVTIIVIIGSIFLIKSYREGLTKRKLIEKENAERSALYNRYQKYETLDSLRDRIYKIDEYIEVKDFSTEKVEKKYPRKEYLQYLIGKKEYLFVKIWDVNTIDNHRVITFAGHSIARDSSIIRLYKPAVDFIFYDNAKKIINVKKGDKLDIIARVDDVIYTKENVFDFFLKKNTTIEVISIYFSVLDLENNLGNFVPLHGIYDNRLD